MPENKELGKFEYAGKKVLLEQTSEGFQVTIDNIDPPLDMPTVIQRTKVEAARRVFEQAVRRALSMIASSTLPENSK